MRRGTSLPLMVAIAGIAAAHPMGNLSVSHYTRLEVSAAGVDVTYVLDLAETPAYQMLREWKLDPKEWRSVPQTTLDEQAAAQARQWMGGLEFRSGGQRVQPQLIGSEIRLTEGVDGLPVARVSSRLRIEDARGPLEFEDRNFTDRAGWKEIVISARDGAQIVTASHGDQDRTTALTQYPRNPLDGREMVPQDLRASVEWELQSKTNVIPRIVPIAQPAAVQTTQPGSANGVAPAKAEPDFIHRLLSNSQLSGWMIMLGVAVAFGLGALHAAEPGHGKTIVAAYLVGSRGTMGHAAFLGGMVTFTHTISVFALGIATLLFSKYFAPEKLIHVLETISGLSIAAIGGWLFYKRLKVLKGSPSHTHDHSHDHSHHNEYPHEHHHDHDHEHHHVHHVHDHGPGGHAHVPEGEITLGSLIALGASGGLVPCPSAMVLLLFAISVGRVGLGLVLLVAFSLGLAGVLMAIGMFVLHAKRWLPDPAKTGRHPLFRLVPVLSAAVIVCLGLALTGASLGWLPRGFGG